MSVYYGGTTHGNWCNTKTRPWRCQYCKEDVFYFTCNHGCKVFFEELGYPWTQHKCKEYLEYKETEKALAAAKELLKEVKGKRKE